MINRRIQPTSQRNFNHASILVIDDNSDQWHLIEKALEQFLPEVQVIWFSTAEEAWHYLNDCTLQGNDLPKLILLDLYLPNRQDGWELLKELKDPASSFKQVPVIVLSYSNDPQDITKSYYHGSTSYLTKPDTSQAWIDFGKNLRTYWWETVTLPSDRFMS
ncbi:response regulator [Spirosoma fluminis]